jgi:hypothetical protein
MGSAVVIDDCGSCVVLIVNGFDGLGMVATCWMLIIGCFGLCWHQLIDEVVDVVLSVVWRTVWLLEWLLRAPTDKPVNM